MFDSTGPQSPAFYYEGQDLTAQEREVVLEALRALPVGKPGRQQLIERFELARRLPGVPPPAAALPWHELEREADRQGCEPLDVFFDRSGRHKEG